MARNYNPHATYRGYRARKQEAEGAAFWVRIVRSTRFFGRWSSLIFLVAILPRVSGHRYESCDRDGCTTLPDDYIAGLVWLVLLVMAVNTIRFRYDRNKPGRHVDPVTRTARAALALSVSALIVVQAARYLDGVRPEVVVLTTFLAADYWCVNWVRRAEDGKQATRRELVDYNYVPHAERHN